MKKRELHGLLLLKEVLFLLQMLFLQVLIMFLGCYRMASHSSYGPLHLIPKMVISQ